jgi:hypothetical protein
MGIEAKVGRIVAEAAGKVVDAVGMATAQVMGVIAKSALGSAVKGAKSRGKSDSKLLPGARAGAKSSPVRAPGEKRSPEEIQRVQERVRAHLTEHPGQRIEDIAKALGAPTRDLSLPIKKMVDAGQFKAEGEKRATRYSVAPGGTA